MMSCTMWQFIVCPVCSDHFVSGEKSNDSASDMERHERLSWPKRERTLRLINRLLQQHLALSEDGNGTLFCEPGTGHYFSATLSMTDIDLLEAHCVNVEKRNKHYQKKC